MHTYIHDMCITQYLYFHTCIMLIFVYFYSFWPKLFYSKKKKEYLHACMLYIQMSVMCMVHALYTHNIMHV